MVKQTILTGLRANNDLTLGNYFGAMLPMVDMAIHKSDEYQINLFVPDLHSFTTPIDHSELQAQIWNNLRLFVAAGLPLNSSNVHIYRQSYISAHSELTWILDCFTGVGEMGRMTEYKNKYEKIGQDRVSVGLFNYPVLMAADILLYNATYVPVGDDQSQHLEFTRDIAERLNNRFGELFTVPKSVKEQHKFFGKDQGLRIMDLADPTKKMSKSDESGKGVIFLGDSVDLSIKKVMSATTDNCANIQYNPTDQPGISNLLEILALVTHQDKKDVLQKWQGKSQYGEFKQEVAHELQVFLENFQSQLAQVDETALKTKLEESEIKMNRIANDTLYRTQKAVGLR